MLRMRLILLLFSADAVRFVAVHLQRTIQFGQSGLPAWHTCGLWWTEGASNKKL